MTSRPAVILLERHMDQPHSASEGEQVVDTMIGLTRLSSLHRAIVAGSDRMEFCLALRRRGFIRVAVATASRLPRRPYSVGLITAQNTVNEIEAALAQISPLLCANAAIAILIASRETGFCLKIRSRLERMGFRIEAGVRCQQGLVLSACRQGFDHIENAA
jgi:hypothetical protein